LDRRRCHSFSIAASIVATQDYRLGFVGAGKMATALARGFLTAGLTNPKQVVASDPSEGAATHFAEVTKGRTAKDNRSVVQESDVVFLAIKPQHLSKAADELRGVLTADHLVVSILAGVPLAVLAERLGERPRLIRVMPNTPCLIGQGASGYALGPNAKAADGELIRRLLSAVGIAFPLEEKLLDAVTGLSGSGPAFVYVMIEALSDGGVRMGLPRDVATALAAQTVAGAARMVLDTSQHPGVLKDQVASPGGTTIRGLQELEEHGVRGALIAAVQAATERSIELGNAS
jgi:pyrroline-5-carboxylate reductase